MNNEKQVTQTLYEWDYESVDEHGDIVDHYFYDTFPGHPVEDNVQLVLVKNVGRGFKSDSLSFSLEHRTWAYVVDGNLPEEFCDGSPVPQRFIKELG